MFSAWTWYRSNEDFSAAWLFKRDCAPICQVVVNRTDTVHTQRIFIPRILWYSFTFGIRFFRSFRECIPSICLRLCLRFALVRSFEETVVYFWNHLSILLH